ncbi:hypothetical protein HPP92_000640 [Vanilla planifolia]|uniref:Protein NEOXANTHIN-DEFICIENT 1 n=1 Tax=Vanilla planifolia TaxID=51239 RepID=A0A835SB41_VANPL|nr:hypothetical protein HPP92_000723 [Vanilla planifolia]KAG0500568.1 hypothetical protein HPP92_000640 [Vanilla planifolia]
MSMEDSKAQLSSGFALGPPWLFKGSALYQLHLVKAEVARAFIPKEFKLVQAFGYTLGGFFLAHYEDSPVATFDELVVIAGIVWNLPCSCAWAARVLVTNEEACRHGRKEIGLPSNVGMFSKQRFTEAREKSPSKYSNFLSMMGICCSNSSQEHVKFSISEVKDSSVMSFCSIVVPFIDPKLHENKSMGPKIRMSLPSFSGRTLHNPHLLKYACQVECRMRQVIPAVVCGPTKAGIDEYRDENSESQLRNKASVEDEALNRCMSIMLSKPVLALQFNFLEMQVDAPTIVAPHLTHAANA